MVKFIFYLLIYVIIGFAVALLTKEWMIRSDRRKGESYDWHRDIESRHFMMGVNAACWPLGIFFSPIYVISGWIANKFFAIYTYLDQKLIKTPDFREHHTPRHRINDAVRKVLHRKKGDTR